MRRHQKTTLLLISVFVICGAAAPISLQGQTKPEEKGKSAVVLRRQDETSPPTEQEVADQLPIVDAASLEPTDPEQRDKRQKKNKRYDNQRSHPIAEAPYPLNVTWSSHWSQGLPAIPVAESNVVLIGEVIDAEAYLSNDKTGIYSEFTISAEDVFKNDGDASVFPGGNVIAERFGGAIRFQSGNMQRYTTANQRMPLVGRQYVFFLKRIGEEHDYSIITGYELRGQRVVPLDGSGAEKGGKLPFDKFKDADGFLFLDTILEAVGKASESEREDDGPR